MITDSRRRELGIASTLQEALLIQIDARLPGTCGERTEKQRVPSVTFVAHSFGLRGANLSQERFASLLFIQSLFHGKESQSGRSKE